MMATQQLRNTHISYVDIAARTAAAGQDIGQFPYVIRILIENLCRHQAWGAAISEREISALLDWQNSIGADLPLHVARVILPDSSGLPVLQDLAALRDAVASHGGNIDAVDARIPVDVIVDHSLQVDHWGTPDAIRANLDKEFERNAERYKFLKWAQQAFKGVRVFPPGSGIIHQINLEHIATVVCKTVHAGQEWAYPDFVIGGDSHTPMINSLGVLGWGVGGIDAEAAMLGQAYTFPIPEVVGVKLTGTIQSPALTTDAALLITQILRRENVAGCMVEFFGPALPQLTIPERATISNMAPEYGATCGYFPVDQNTLDYLVATGRPEEQVNLVKLYCDTNNLLHRNNAPTPQYSRTVEINLDQAEPSVAGPRRPQDRLPITAVQADFNDKLHKPFAEGGFNISTQENGTVANPARIQHGSVVLAAITSCTNTSNPVVMLAAGLVAKKAIEYGLKTAPWVKTSMAPGSRAVTEYLSQAGLLPYLEQLGFFVIGYGCTTCGGKSGPLDPTVVQSIEEQDLVVAAVLSGNRNFEGRIHKMIRANYIGAPPLVVAYALAGRIDIDFSSTPVGYRSDGQPVYLNDLWPSPSEISALLPFAFNKETFSAVYNNADGPDAGLWQQLPSPTGKRFPWNPDSHYLVEPPFFKGDLNDNALDRLQENLQRTYVLAAFNDSLTTDHISPGGEIPLETPAGKYLSAAGISPRDFNTYVARRCNFEVMSRATFANIRVKNALVPDIEGGFTRHFPDDVRMTIYDAAQRYQRNGQSVIILAGKEYGTGSSRDWAAKGSTLLGVQAVIAESFERIHRANLVGMGILPLAFLPGQGWRQLGLTGSECYAFHNVKQSIQTGDPIDVTAHDQNGDISFRVVPQVLTEAERELLAAGGIPTSVLRAFTQGKKHLHAPQSEN